MNNHPNESYFTICHGASFSSKVSVAMKKNKLFKLKNNQSTKQVSITMKKISYSKSSEEVHSTTYMGGFSWIF